MKIVYVANVRMPTEKAHGFQIMKMCEAFADLENEVTLIAPRRLNPIKDDPFDYYGIKKNFKIVRMPCLDLLPIFKGKLSFLIEEASFYLATKIFLAGLKNYDSLYVREIVAAIFFKDVYFEVHNLPKKIGFWFRRAIKNSARFFPVTKCLADDLEKAGAPRQKIMVAPDGVDLRAFEKIVDKQTARRQLNFPNDKRIVLYAGSFYLYDWKGTDIMIESAKNFSEDTLFVLVGGNEEEMEKIKGRGLPGNVLLIGRKSPKEIPIYLSAADILILPNKAGFVHSERYTSPLKLFEYMAAGKPIIASDLPSIREVLNESNSVLVKPSDAGALAEAIKAIINNPERAQKISSAALIDVKKYSWSSRAEKIMKVMKVVR